MELVENLILTERTFRSEILKWKLVSVGAVASVGLGFQGHLDSPAWALCALPWFCVYADILYRASCIRRDIARQFILKQSKEDSSLSKLREYMKHEYRWQSHFGHFSLDAGAIVISTLIICSLIVAYGLTISIYTRLSNALLISGILGSISALTFEFIIYRRQHAALHAPIQQ